MSDPHQGDFIPRRSDACSDPVNDLLSRAAPEQQTLWRGLLQHAATATTARPSTRWLKQAATLVQPLGERCVAEAVQGVFTRTAQPARSSGRGVDHSRRSADVPSDESATRLRGLLWLTTQWTAGADLLRAITAIALWAYRKLPGVGPRAVKVGNAAVFALSRQPGTDAVGQLAVLKTRVKFAAAQKEIEKAFTQAAEALGLPRDQIEELSVPDYGLEAGGRRVEALGDDSAEIVVTGSDAELRWRDSSGKALQSLPARLKSEHAVEVHELKELLKDIRTMLPAQRDRIEGMFLQQSSWAIDVWRERYLEHPLVGTIAARLIWCVDGMPVLFVDGRPLDVHGEPVPHGRTAEVTLWHPVGQTIEDVLAWRERLDSLAITQPFKQAYREVYLLTDAERRTNTYSNRFAAHVLRQHQFHALCAARGWKDRLRLRVDDAYEPPQRWLPHWGLRAEFWVEGLGGDYGVDLNESGVYLRLSTDQVRFYRTEAAPNFAHAVGGGYMSWARGAGTEGLHEPLPLDQIPALVFSEIMRDVDLFVGVASVGNDPTWHDGGPQGRFLDYWQSYSFGDLTATAATRKQVLERLIPRLKIAPRCSFSDRFLVVRGDRRTYKIHLGSGNILMEPNDQYLCIVPDARTRAASSDVHLPFEGDQTLSIILSKALLLADDAQIKDPTITRQITP